MKGFGVFGIYLLVLAATAHRASAQAPPPLPTPTLEDTTMAKMRFERGMAHFRLDEFQAAVEQWEEAFRLKPDPAFLYNIAQAYRLAKRPEKALVFYEKYLKMSPKAANHDEVERHIAGLKRLLKEQAKSDSKPPAQAMGDSSLAATAPDEGAQAGLVAKAAQEAASEVALSQASPAASPTPTVALPAASPTPTVALPAASPTPTVAAADKPAAAPGSTLSTASPAAPAGAAPAGVELAVAAPPPTRPVYKRAWFWGVVGGAAVAAAVVVVALAARGGGSTVSQLPRVEF